MIALKIARHGVLKNCGVAHAVAMRCYRCVAL